MRSHGWRTTLNSIYYWLPPRARRLVRTGRSVNKITKRRTDGPVTDGDRGAGAAHTTTGPTVHRCVADDVEGEDGIGVDTLSALNAGTKRVSSQDAAGQAVQPKDGFTSRRAFQPGSINWVDPNSSGFGFGPLMAHRG